MTAPYACLHCLEDVTPDDAHPLNEGSSYVHGDCLIRMTVGSLGHQMGLCSCHGGTLEDPPGMTARQAAAVAAGYFRLLEPPRSFVEALALLEERP